MILLSLEFSSDVRSVALFRGGRLCAVASHATTQSTPTFAMIRQVLEQAGISREELTHLAVGLGPGSYTGIRIAIATAQGWHLGRPLSVSGVSSADALAWTARQQGLRGRINLVIDAQRNEFYTAGYELHAESETAMDPLRLASREQLQELQAQGSKLVGPNSSRWFADTVEVAPGAEAVGRLALASDASIPPERLEPIYLRPVAFVKAESPRFPSSPPPIPG